VGKIRSISNGVILISACTCSPHVQWLMHNKLLMEYIEEKSSLLKAGMIFYIPGISAMLQSLEVKTPR